MHGAGAQGKSRMLKPEPKCMAGWEGDLKVSHQTVQESSPVIISQQALVRFPTKVPSAPPTVPIH